MRGGYLVPRRRQLVEVGGVAELARLDALGVLGEAQPGDRERCPKGLVLLVLVGFSHTQAVFGVTAVDFTVTHRLVLPRYFVTTTQRLQGCYAFSGTIVEIVLDTPRA